MKTRKHSWCLALLALAVIGGDKPVDGAPSLEKKTISLRQAVGMALENNRDIEISRYQPMIGDESITSALGRYDVVLSTSASGGESISQSSNFFTGAPVVDEDTFAASIGLSHLTPFGMSAKASFESKRFNSTSSYFSLNPRWEQTLGITLTMPLLKGGWYGSNYDAVILVARNNRDISVHAFAAVLTQVTMDVQKAFWELVYAIENKKVTEEALKVAERFRDETVEREKVGRSSKLDVIQAMSGVASQEEGVINAEKLVRNAEDRLKLLIDPALLSRRLEEEALLPVAELSPPEREFDAEAALTEGFATALAMRPDCLQTLKRIHSQELLLHKAEQDVLPKLDLTGTAALLGLEDDFGNAVDKTMDERYRSLSGGIVLEFPLGNLTARGDRNKARLDHRVLLLERKKLEEQVLLEVREAVREIKAVEKRIAATRESEELAKAQFEAEEERQKQGVSTMYDVLEKQREYTRARTNATRALIDERIALLALQKANGTLLEKNDILIKDALSHGSEPHR